MRALDPLHVRRDAFVALAAHAFGPRHRGAGADLLLPFRADLRQVVGPDERRARAVRATDDRDQLVGQLDARIEIGDRLLVPLLDLAEVDVGEHGSRELHRAGRDAFDVHDRHDAADDRRKLHEAGGLQVLGLERHVGRAEVDGLGLDLGDAAARADRLVVHADAGLLLVRLGPLGVDRVRKRRAGAGDVDRRGVEMPNAIVAAARNPWVRYLRIAIFLVGNGPRHCRSRVLQRRYRS